MKINRYMQQYGISQSTLAKVAAKASRNGSMNPMAWRRKPLSEAEVLESAMLSYPLTQYMFCSPAEGGVALVLARADIAHRFTDRPIYLKAAVVRSRRRKRGDPGWGSQVRCGRSFIRLGEPPPASAAI